MTDGQKMNQIKWSGFVLQVIQHILQVTDRPYRCRKTKLPACFRLPFLFCMWRSVMVAARVICVSVCGSGCLLRDRGSVNMTLELCQLSSGVRGGACVCEGRDEEDEGKGGCFVSSLLKEDL